MQITNVRVYDLEESVIASGNAMRTEPLSSFQLSSKEEFAKGIERMKRLVHCSKETDVHCHDNALTGIRVSFDITYPQYWSMEAQRYHFLDIVTSSSKMHRLCKMDIAKACNEWVTSASLLNMQSYIDRYNIDPCEENFMVMISNCPMGLQLFERCSTNYKQLQTIYHQRHNHRLPEWREFCEWILTLPYSHELILGE